MSKIKVILNPIAGMNSAAAKIPLIKNLLEKHSVEYELVCTERVGHAIELAERTDPNDFAIVIAAGGDGTCNEVFNGLMKSKNSGRAIPAMGALPIGRGNDFAYAMGLPQDLEENIVILSRGYRKHMDVGKIVGGLYPQGRYFGNGIGIGFSTIVGFEAAKMKRLHGFITYVVGALKTLFLYYHAPHLKIELDHQIIDQKSIETSVMIGRRFGGAFFMAPDAVNDDGLFDLCIANNAPRLEMLKLMGMYMKGTQKENKYIITHRSRTVTLSATQGTLAVHADGETICENGTRIEIECLPRQLEIVTREQ
jgi:diacylglycerol kinase (ATP)